MPYRKRNLLASIAVIGPHAAQDELPVSLNRRIARLLYLFVAVYIIFHSDR